MFLLRDVHPHDLDGLEKLARHLNTLNLPDDRAQLEGLIAWSQQSFSGQIDDPKECEFVFVLEDLERDELIGTALIIAQHGTYKRPAVYFNVRHEQKYSETLDKYFIHQVLQLQFNYDGATEIGGLVLHPHYRGHAQRLGKLLSFVRFLYIGMHRPSFRDDIIAELLPELNPNGTSDLWDCLGAQFTELDYMTADKLSRENIEFIRSLFPHTPIYTALLPTNVREKIGKVGGPTKPVEKMLQSVGFEYDNSIDPFDGGPTFRVQTDECELVKRVQAGCFVGQLPYNAHAEGRALVGFEQPQKGLHFRALLCDYKRTEDGLLLRSPALNALPVGKGDRCAMLPLSGKGLERLY